MPYIFYVNTAICKRTYRSNNVIQEPRKYVSHTPYTFEVKSRTDFFILYAYWSKKKKYCEIHLSAFPCLVWSIFSWTHRSYYLKLWLTWCLSMFLRQGDTSTLVRDCTSDSKRCFLLEGKGSAKDSIKLSPTLSPAMCSHTAYSSTTPSGSRRK